ncbi:uncharacterized protein G2W53_004636 [Senna tora]|uniref:Uncharacterized protein n=1 Tax=Senna tora TaxID=362788 RepID=A0A834XFK7_9FABA|nr:uncharacterized protein G2W53_004636 [Senna tora]
MATAHYQLQQELIAANHREKVGQHHSYGAVAPFGEKFEELDSRNRMLLLQRHLYDVAAAFRRGSMGNSRIH